MIADALLGLTGDEARWSGPLSEACAAYDIEPGRRQAMFVAQCAHESGGFKRLVEDLHYKPETLLKLWPRRFTPTLAHALQQNELGVAERIYGGRMGNGIEGTGDGFKYRGRGLFQVTGKANYRACGRALSVDLEASPELLELPEFAALSAGWYWQAHGCNELADANNFVGVTKAINGGTNGLDDRVAWYEKALRALA